MQAKQLTRFSIIVLLYILIGIYFNSCCLGTNYYRLTGEMFLEAYKTPQAGSLELFPVDTIESEFQIYGLFEREFIEYTQVDWKPFTEVYATTCAEAIVNPLDPESLNMSLDRDFYLDTDIIPANTNIENFSGIDADVYDEDIRIFFHNDFLDQAVFDTGAYVFNIQIMNFDTIPEKFSAEISLFMDLQ